MQYYKVIVFSPNSHTDILIHTMSAAGAGNIGNYSHTCFITKGYGNWYSKENAKPYSGKENYMNREEEDKIEMLCEKEYKERVIQAILDVHPYEKPEIDVINIEFFTK